MDVIVVCHTEFGIVKNGQVIATKDPDGVSKGVANLNKIASQSSVKVTYAVCPEVALYFPASALKTGEIGLHIHPGWEEFHKEGVSFFVGDAYLQKHYGPTRSTVLQDYALEEQTGLISVGKECLSRYFGIPKVFLSGRWSINGNTLKALAKLGFSHDCSAFPSYSDDHFDWSRLPRICAPYYPSTEDHQVHGDCPVLIVPTSQMLKGGCVNPENARIYRSWWLMTCFEEYYRRNQNLFHICVHSPALLDPYMESVMSSLLQFIRHHKNVNFKFASEVKVNV